MCILLPLLLSSGFLAHCLIASVYVNGLLLMDVNARALAMMISSLTDILT
jgi:hypothetical protein